MDAQRALTAAAARALAALLTVAGAATAQFVNRAVWLGLDEEGVRRDYGIGTEYLLDRASYVIEAPWWDPDLRRFGDAVRYRLGSTSSREFTVEGNIDHRIVLGDGVSFRYHLLQGENRDTRFLRNVVGLEYEFDGGPAVFAQGTPLADKSLVDISLGAWLWRDGDDALRAMITMVDAPSEKSLDVEYERAPYGLHLAGVFGDPDDVRVAFELGAQLPMELRRLEDRSLFELQRYIGTVEARVRVGERDTLVAALESEYTDKELRPVGDGDPLAERFDRTFHQLRVEWWRDGETPWSVGFMHDYLSELGRRRNDPANDLRMMRREWFAVARCRLRIDDKLSFEPQLLAGNVRDLYRDGLVQRDRDRFEGKIAWNARWDFSPNVYLSLIVSTQLDELAFGGGGAQFVARF